MKHFARKHKAFSMSFLFFAAAMIVPALLSAVSETDKDDVAAMVTTARKAPNTIFIIDTSEAMNSFAYSDYIEVCADAIANADNAASICDTSYTQCQRIKSQAASCAGDIDCDQISQGCKDLRDAKTKLVSYCAQVDQVYKFPDYPREDRTKRPSEVANGTLLRERFVGPWDPDKFYDADLCFYDWTQDTGGEVLNGTTSEYWNNLSSDTSKHTTVDGETYKNTDRRDWDCVTDGQNNMSNGQKYRASGKEEKSGSGYTGAYSGGVSGFWLNWKYTTSLDAVKILLGNTHEFSNPPRSRGENKCFRYDYYPLGSMNSTDCEIDAETGDCAVDENGNIKYIQEKVCFISPQVSEDDDSDFDTAYLNDGNRDAILKALKTAVAESWDGRKIGELNGTNCTNYDEVNDFSFYDNLNSEGLNFDKGAVNHPAAVLADDSCKHCLLFNGSTSNPDFVETDCKIFTTQENESTIVREGSLGSYSAAYKQGCCRTSECEVPKCRDNDLYCYNDGNECVLGYYSEYDQDKNHCCDQLKCVTGEEVTGDDAYITHDDGCKSCKTGTPVTKETVTDSLYETTVLQAPSDGYSYNTDISFSVSVSSISGVEDIDSLSVKVYYKCLQNNSIPECTNPTWKDLSTYSCTGGVDDNANCVESGEQIVSANLSDCEKCGYSIKAEVSASPLYCKMGDSSFSVSLKYNLPEGNLSGKEEYRKIFDPEKPYYMILRNEATGATSEDNKVGEYECRTAFYHTQAFDNEGHCPRSQTDIVNAFHRKGYPDVEYCDTASRYEKLMDIQIGWGKIQRIYFCSYLCRDAMVYDDAWKCMAAFYQMDEVEVRNGLEKCSTQCNAAAGISGGVNHTEDCCRCISDNYHDREPWNAYRELQPSEGVMMPVSNGSQTKKLYHCAVSAYQGNNVQSGWFAEITNGHIREADENKKTSYLLSPYLTEDGTLYSPYRGWIADKTFFGRKTDPNGGFKDTKISGFKTSSSAARRNVCVYDLLQSWGGTLCGGSCRTCSSSVCGSRDEHINVADDKCAYPSFWMKVPQSEGGELIFSGEELQTKASQDEFQKKIRKLKAVGGATLGETLYDAWRFLGGMYALHDPNHVPSTGEPYISPFENSDPSCFVNEVVVLSGGQAQFDHNDKVGGTCPRMNANSTDKDHPCVSHSENVNADQRPHTPYFNSDWYQTSILNVANFVKSHSFWSDKCKIEGEDACEMKCRRNPNISANMFGYSNDAQCKDSQYESGTSKAVVNTIHSGAIGEWVVASLYNKTEFKYLEKITKKIDPTDDKAKNGRYCSLTLGQVNSDNCQFRDITSVLTNLLTEEQSTDVNSGRPHWTSSIVQPFDVEEKYRGPEAYVAGTVPIAPAKSRFWFGNLKKYMIDHGDDSCGITISDTREEQNDTSACGEWRKQTFASSADCFVQTDTGSEMNREEFSRLLAGGAARQLSDSLRKTSCSDIPCFKNTEYDIPAQDTATTGRKIYFDKGNSMKLLKSITDADFAWMADKMGKSETIAQKVLDYMYGYDSFVNDTDARRKKLRFGYSDSATGDTIEVLDPIDIDFDHTKKVTIRPLLLGAIVHSKPVAVYYGDTNTTRIFAGANDGMLHAFDGSGYERWAYIPSNVLKKIGDIASATSTNVTFNSNVDGPITMMHIDKNHDGIINGTGEDKESAYLIFGYRRGATGYTVIDISDKDDPKFVQNLNTDGGLSFGKATVFRKCPLAVCSYADELTYYLAVPGGYDECNDGDKPICRMPGNDQDERAVQYGNKFRIYKFDKTSKKFIDTAGNYFSFEYSASDNNKKWLVSSFASAPFAINTSGKGAVGTEFVYFTDLTGTVFRVDVREASMSSWSTKVVFATRSLAGDTGGTSLWTEGKSYASPNMFPPLERYNPGSDATRIPVPIVFGDASWPKIDTEAASMTVFYDLKDSASGEIYDSYDASKFRTQNLNNGNKFYEPREEYVGWRITFGSKSQKVDSSGEKGITNPLLVYDVYGSKSDAASGKNGYSMAWTTYIPKKTTECKNFGTSYNYERLVIDGSQAQSLTTGMTANSSAVGEWNPANCTNSSSDQGASVATAVGVVATDKGYDLTYGAGAEIYRKQEISVVVSSTRIIKWYELY